MCIELNTKIIGNGPPLIILHGLFGSWENWGAQAKQFANNFTVYAMDARNHGLSKHSDRISYDLMTSDVLCTMKTLNIVKSRFIGHSMGGKTAMQLAVNNPDKVSRLLVVDITPKSYAPSHESIFSALMGLNLDKITSRSDADRQIQKSIFDSDIRAFLLKNLYRKGSGFRWRFDLNSLFKNYSEINREISSTSTFQGPTLFIKGALSNYIQKQDEAAITRYFPNPSVKVIAGAGHWPHTQKSAVFYKIATDFLAL